MSEHEKSQYRFPATYSQAALWYVERSRPGNRAYDLLSACWLSGHFDAQALGRALQFVTDRHDSLRTRFVEEDEGLWQLVEGGILCNTETITVEGEQEVPPIVQRFALQTFELTSAPLMRALVVRVSAERHLVALKFHHIIVDQPSIAIIVSELETAYAAFVLGRAPDLEPIEIDYGDYSAWQYEDKTADSLKPKLERWQPWVDEPFGCINLPFDNPRPLIQSFQGRELFIDVSPALAASIRSAARQRATSPFVLLLSCYALTLALYARQPRVVVGVPFGNRFEDESLQHIVGLFINTLPVVIDVDWSAHFDSLVEEVSERVLRIQSAQDVPLQLLMQTLPVVRDAAYNPLFQCGFSVQPAAASFAPEGLTSEPIPAHAGGAPYDQQVWVLEEPGGGFRIQIWFDEVLYRRESIERQFDFFLWVTQQVIAAPQTALCDIPLLSEADEVSLRDFSHGARNATDDGTLGAYLYGGQSLRTGQSGALLCADGRRLTHAQLESLARQVAARLHALGLGPGDRIGLLLERELELLPVVLGCALAGVCYVPLDPDYPKSLLDYVIQDSRVSHLLAHDSVVNRLELPETVTLQTVESLFSQLRESDATYKPEPFAEDTPMYVIYTSGSTGRPKGVVVGHRSVVNLLQSIQQKPGLGANDRLLAVTTLSFDISVWDLFGPIAAGAQLVLASKEQSLDPRALVELLRTHQISVMQATPGVWRLLVETAPEALKPVSVWSTGEALPAELAGQLLACSRELWNLYGPTEATVWSSVSQVQDAQQITIGEPVAQTQLLVLDEYGRPVPIGVPGELYIGGRGLAQGYLEREALTAERFVELPCAPDQRLYRTGDLVRWRYDGQLLHLGRLDHQIKIRGFRVELGHIESVLTADERIAEALVHTHTTTADDQQLAAYVVPVLGEDLSVGELRRLVLNNVPNYMVPQFFLVLDALPRTPNGKIDRGALPDPAGLLQGIGNQPPSSVTEQEIAEIWSKYVGVDSVSVADNFFAIGGHSLLAIRALDEINTRFNTKIKLAAFLAGTLGDIAQLVDEGPLDQGRRRKGIVKELTNWVFRKET